MKTVTVLYDRESRGRQALGQVLGALGRELCAGQEALTLYVADEHVDFSSPSPFPLFSPRPAGVIEAWGEPLPLDALEAAGFTAQQWESDATQPTEYGGNRHAEPRDWPDGERSPGVVLISLLERPRNQSVDAWIAGWHGGITVVSEEFQPRSRYIRNHLVRALTPEAPPWEGLVVEAWPSRKHLVNPWLFYGASSPWELIRNQGRILLAVSRSFRIWRIHTVVVSEYILLS